MLMKQDNLFWVYFIGQSDAPKIHTYHLLILIEQILLCIKQNVLLSKTHLGGTHVNASRLGGLLTITVTSCLNIKCRYLHVLGVASL